MAGQARMAALALAAGRVGIGVALCAAPGLAEPWVGKAARTPGGRLLTRTTAVRDAALGLVTIASAGDAARLRRCLVISSACDAADFAVTLTGPRTPAREAVLAIAAGATVAGLVAAAALGDAG